MSTKNKKKYSHVRTDTTIINKETRKILEFVSQMALACVIYPNGLGRPPSHAISMFFYRSNDMKNSQQDIYQRMLFMQKMWILLKRNVKNKQLCYKSKCKKLHQYDASCLLLFLLNLNKNLIDFVIQRPFSEELTTLQDRTISKSQVTSSFSHFLTKHTKRTDSISFSCTILASFMYL